MMFLAHLMLNVLVLRLQTSLYLGLKECFHPLALQSSIHVHQMDQYQHLPSALPGIIGGIISWILNRAKDVVSWVSQNL